MAHRRNYKDLTEWDDIGWAYLREHDPYLQNKQNQVGRFLEYPYLSIRQLEHRRRHEFLIAEYKD
jgi:hypothetical protein